jgi:hypothetical protein
MLTLLYLQILAIIFCNAIRLFTSVQTKEILLVRGTVALSALLQNPSGQTSKVSANNICMGEGCKNGDKQCGKKETRKVFPFEHGV